MSAGSRGHPGSRLQTPPSDITCNDCRFGTGPAATPAGSGHSQLRKMRLAGVEVVEPGCPRPGFALDLGPGRNRASHQHPVLDNPCSQDTFPSVASVTGCSRPFSWDVRLMQV